MTSRRTVYFFVALVGLGLMSGLTSGTSAQTGKANPVVVELFTSQGCYSCPPAEEYLGELSKNPNIVALEFHVDYWDDLVYGAAGKWKDVFSQPEFTKRQRVYAGNFPGGQVYTPQMVVDGKSFAVGSRRHDVRRLIAKAQESKMSMPRVAVTKKSADNFEIDIKGRNNRAQSIWLVRYLKNVTTRVRAGENKGKKLTSHNIVTQVKRLSKWQGLPTKVDFKITDFKADEGCAVIIQEESQGPIYAAALCPEKPINS